jgi:hypothetical protein
LGASLDLRRDGRELDRKGSDERNESKRAKKTMRNSMHKAFGWAVFGIGGVDDVHARTYESVLLMDAPDHYGAPASLLSFQRGLAEAAFLATGSYRYG